MVLNQDEKDEIKSICDTDIDEELLEQIFVHSSFGNQNNYKHNQVLATLGDAVLKLALGLVIYEKNSNVSRRYLTEKKADYEANSKLGNLPLCNKLLPYIRRIPDESKTEKDKESEEQKIKAELYEALCYAIYAGRGIEVVKEFVKKTLMY